MFLPTIGSAGLWDSPPIPLTQTPLWSCFSMQAENDSPSSEPSAVNYTVAQLQDMYDNCHIPTVIEDYRAYHTQCYPSDSNESCIPPVTTRLFGPVINHTLAGDAIREPSAANATLRALESALADATAMAMWSAARANTLTVSCPTDNLAGQLEELWLADGAFVLPLSTVLAPVNGSTVVQGRKLAAHITVSLSFVQAPPGILIRHDWTDRRPLLGDRNGASCHSDNPWRIHTHQRGHGTYGGRANQRRWSLESHDLGKFGDSRTSIRGQPAVCASSAAGGRLLGGDRERSIRDSGR